MENAESKELNKSSTTTESETYLLQGQGPKENLEHGNIGDMRSLRQRDEFFDATSKNNNHHVVPIGVLIVLVTLYLGMNGIQKCFVTCTENQTIGDLLQKPGAEEKNIFALEGVKGSQLHILERLLEYKDICQDLEVFTKDGYINNYTNEKRQTVGRYKEKKRLLVKNTHSVSDNGSGSGSGNGDCVKPYSKKNKKTKHLIKLPTNVKNGFHKYNKSTKAKYTKMDKKDLTPNKKNSTAEPIIYLFALVFIYLLLKAASDINQHYKSQNKNDKRLRRCSLQSYAQTHRPDRRASKASESALKQKQQRLLAMSTRSFCIERPPQFQQHLYHHRYLEGSPKRSTPSTPPTQFSMCIRKTTPSNWQLLRQHITTQSVDNSDITTSHVSKADAAFCTQEFNSIRNRRCSVPVALNYQQRQVPTSLPLGVHHNDQLANRRTSITMPADVLDGLATTEIKRRVRMINRH